MLLWPALYTVEFCKRDGTVIRETTVVAASDHHAGAKAWDYMEQQLFASADLDPLVNEQGYLRVMRADGEVRANTNGPHRGRPKTVRGDGS